jgi:hypothetical protein
VTLYPRFSVLHVVLETEFWISVLISATPFRDEPDQYETSQAARILDVINYVAVLADSRGK